MLKQITIADLSNQTIIDSMTSDDNRSNYYYSHDWSPKFYVMQAYEGFMAVSYQNMVLLPEMQVNYCVISLNPACEAHDVLKSYIPQNNILNQKKNYGELISSKSVLKKLRRSPGSVRITMNKDIEGVLKGIEETHGEDNWLQSRYATLIRELMALPPNNEHFFRFISVELWYEEKLVAGEVGYAMGSVYSSLTGFSHKEYKTAFGTVQLLVMAQILKRAGFNLWNLGHPPRGHQMKYKSDIGGVVITRGQFIRIWRMERTRKTNDNAEFTDILLSGKIGSVDGEDATDVLCHGCSKVSVSF